MFSFISKLRSKKQPFVQTPTEEWKETWRCLVPPECRNVPVTVDGITVVAYVLINHYAMMLQDGLLMEENFFHVCEHFQRAGYHVVWLMRCTQDVHNGYLKPGRVVAAEDASHYTRRFWSWKKPTTNFEHWISDNCEATIIIQHTELCGGAAGSLKASIGDSQEQVLSRVTWAVSNDPRRLVPGHTDFQTADLPATPAQLRKWLQGESLTKLGN